MRFDFEATFGDDYLHFYAGELTDERNERDTDDVVALRRSHHSVRLPAITELREWLLGAGFSDVEFRARDGETPSIDRRGWSCWRPRDRRCDTPPRNSGA